MLLTDRLAAPPVSFTRAAIAATAELYRNSSACVYVFVAISLPQRKTELGSVSRAPHRLNTGAACGPGKHRRSSNQRSAQARPSEMCRARLIRRSSRVTGTFSW